MRHLLQTISSQGFGNGSISIHPDLAVRRIRETVAEAVKRPAAACMYPLPDHFHVEIYFKLHIAATSASWYPGCKQTGPFTVEFDADDYMDVLKFIHFVL